MPVRLNGSTSGYTELDAGAVAGNNTLKMPVSNGAANQLLRNGATPGTLEFGGAIVSGTAVASTSGTSIDFTGIPSWVKRVTVMLNGVSLSATALIRFRLADSTVATSGYTGSGSIISTAVATVSQTAGFDIYSSAPSAANVFSGSITFSTIGSNVWIAAGVFADTSARTYIVAGSITLSSALTQVRITSSSTDTFDAGSINILYE